MSFVLFLKELTRLPFGSAPAAQTAIVHGVASLHKDPEASLHSQSHRSTPSQKAATMLFGAAVLANCPHVLGRAGVGAACGETLNCLSRNIRSAILLAVPTHMALFFIFGCTQWKGEERDGGRAEERMRRKRQKDRGKIEGQVERDGQTKKD